MDEERSSSGHAGVTRQSSEPNRVPERVPQYQRGNSEGTSSPIIIQYYHHHEHVTQITDSTIETISVQGATAGPIQSEDQKKNEEETKEKRDGWFKLSGTFSMYNAEPLHPHTQVYEAEQTHGSGKIREVVAKLIPKDKNHEREIDILLDLDDHPNIVKIIDSGVIREPIPQLYVIMERCHQNLKQYIGHKNSQRISVPVPKAKSFFKQMISAIVFIHGRKIVHRDLKPSNILISSDEESLKVADFGISRKIPDDRTQVTVTCAEAGTRGFKPPEAYQDASKIGYKADVFQMGLNGYYIFTTGQHPFGEDCDRQAVNIKSNDTPDISGVPQFPGQDAHCKEMLTSLLNRMLAHSPADRPTAEQVLSDNFFKDQPQDSRDSSERPQRQEISARAAMLPVQAPGAEETPQREASRREPPQNSVNSPDVARLSESLRQYDPILRPHEADRVSNLLVSTKNMLMEGNEQEAIRRVKDCIPASFSALDVKDMAFHLRTTGLYVYAIMLCHVSNEIHKTQNPTGNETLKWIRDRVADIRGAAAKLKRSRNESRDTIVKYALSCMNDLLRDLRAVQNVGGGDRAVNAASCIVSISRIQIDFGGYRSAIDICNEGVTHLETEFGSNVSQHKYYGQMLNNIAEAYAHMPGRRSDADRFFNRALTAKVNANYDNDDAKKKDIEATQRSMRKRKP